MKEKSTVRLTSGEIGNLWTQYMNDSMATCVLSHTLQNTKDKEIYSVFEFALNLSKSHIEKIKEFLTEEKFPVPVGFTMDDVNLDAPPLFTDTFMMFYLYTMTLHGLNGYSLSVGNSVRQDQRDYFIQVQRETMRLFDMIIDVMLEKGIFSRSPLINPKKEVDFVKKQDFLTGWLGKRRPLNAIEVSTLYYNMQKMQAKIGLELGFSQVAKTEEIREYFRRGVGVCAKQLEVMGSILSEENLPSPKSKEDEVTNSTIAPFSEKLMLFHTVSLLSVTVGYYGTALSVSQRRDIMAQYARLMNEIGLYSEDGLNLMIKYGWLEQPPTVDDRFELGNN